MSLQKNTSGPLMLAWLGLALLAGLVRDAEAAPLCESCGPQPARSLPSPAPMPVPPPAPDVEELAADGTPDAVQQTARHHADPGTPGLQRRCRGAQTLEPIDVGSSEYGVALVACDDVDLVHGGR